MAFFQVDSDRVLSTNMAMNTTIATIRTEVERLNSQLVELESSWTGQASAAFSGVVAEWRSTQRIVEQNLETISTALGEAGRRYAEIESANAHMFHG